MPSTLISQVDSFIFLYNSSKSPPGITHLLSRRVLSELTHYVIMLKMVYKEILLCVLDHLQHKSERISAQNAAQ